MNESLMNLMTNLRDSIGSFPFPSDRRKYRHLIGSIEELTVAMYPQDLDGIFLQSYRFLVHHHDDDDDDDETYAAIVV